MKILNERLNKVKKRIDQFFEQALVSKIPIDIDFYLAGSCLKEDIYRDIDLIFPFEHQYLQIISAIDTKYFQYKNNSMTYRFENDIMQFVCIPRYTNKTLDQVIEDFDFSSTKIGYHFVFSSKINTCRLVNSIISEDFITYLDTKINDVCTINKNPFITLQRAIHFLKRGDDVPLSTFLKIFTEVNKVEIKDDFIIEEFVSGFSGDENSLANIKLSIENYLTRK